MIYLITGGSGSGKSQYAENLLATLGSGERIYIATMKPYGEEGEARVRRHRLMRMEKHFQTIECYTNLEVCNVPGGSLVLLECMSNLVANEMFEPEGSGEETVAAVLRGIKSLEKKCAALVIVTNEVFSDGMQYDGDMERYLSYLGEVNRKIADMAEYVVEVVYSIPVYYKGDVSKLSQQIRKG